MSDFKCAEMDGIPPFPENGEPVAVTVPDPTHVMWTRP